MDKIFTKYIMKLEEGETLSEVFNAWSPYVKAVMLTSQRNRCRYAFQQDGVILNVTADTTLPELEQRYQDYAEKRKGDPSFRGDVAADEELVISLRI
ncbi:MAG: hypothetical protein ACXW30_00320 [Micavibrio sp.]